MTGHATSTTSKDPASQEKPMKGKILRAVALRRSFALVFVLRRTELVLAGRSRSQIFADIGTALDRKELPALEPGAMCYMLSKQGYLSDRDGHWRPHLMFFVPLTEPASWGVGLPGSPVVVAFTDTPERHTVFLVPVAKWSDGTADPTAEH